MEVDGETQEWLVNFKNETHNHPTEIEPFGGTAGLDHRVLLLSDHLTLTATRGHDGGPVPFLLYDSREDSGNGLPYTEASGKAGPFVENGSTLLDLLFQK